MRLRTAEENIDNPEHWLAGSNATLVNYPVGGKNGQGVRALSQGLVADNPSAGELRTRMVATYGDFATVYGPAFAQAFQQLKSGLLPLL